MIFLNTIFTRVLCLHPSPEPALRNRRFRRVSTFLAVGACLLPSNPSRAEDGYEAWLRYPSSDDSVSIEEYREGLSHVIVSGDSSILKSAGDELARGLSGLLGRETPLLDAVDGEGAVVVGSGESSALIRDLIPEETLSSLGAEGFAIQSVSFDGKKEIAIAGATDRGALYGVFAFLRLLQTGRSIDDLEIVDRPVCKLRTIDHWDNLDGSVERGYAGRSIFHWDNLPELDPRYKDYARVLASIGINGVVLNNVNSHKDKEGPYASANSNKQILTAPLLTKLAALADVFRAYGIQVFVCPSFASPVWLDEFDTADPLDPKVREWWRSKTDEIYTLIPDFGGFLVKADSEGQSGPSTYGRDHAEGANMLAEALEPHGGLVIWRAFVYGNKKGDRAKQAYENFHPLDGRFKENVIVQCKNGPMDFQVREPVSPLFGRLPETNMMLELQITQEYTGYSTHLCYLVPQWKYYLEFDTHAKGEGTTLARIVDGSAFDYKYSGIAGVSNIGADRNWTRHPLAQANLYGFGRLAWNPDLSSEEITEEWVRMTFGNDPQVVETLSRMLLSSWRIYENYTSPLGVGFLCGSEDPHLHHYDPDPAGRQKNYHHADEKGVGYDRTKATGSGYTEQYPPPAAALFESLETCPDELLLFFHHVPYSHKLNSGKTVIRHIYDTHIDGVEQARGLKKDWESLRDSIDAERHRLVSEKLEEQIEHAILWRDTINRYFEEVSGIPIVD